MIDGKIIRYNCSWFYLKKRHYCPNCKTILELKKREVVVNSESDEAKNYDFFCVDTYLCGNIKFVTFYFECLNCRTVYEISKLKLLEKRRRKQERTGDCDFNNADEGMGFWDFVGRDKMMKIIVILLFCVVMLNSCSYKCNNDTDYKSNMGGTVLETTVNEINSTGSNIPDKCNELSDEEAIEIAKNCLLTISASFNETENVPYKDVFYYYTIDGCYTPDRNGIPFNVIQYYDAQKMTFSIPYKIVDSFLEKKFNTQADRYSIKYFNPDTECYEFNQNFGEYYYDFTLISKEKLNDSKYSFEVKIKHALSDVIPVQHHKYVIEIVGDDFKILSRLVEVDNK